MTMEQAPIPLYINGQRHFTPATFPNINPSTATPISNICTANQQTIDAAVRAGHAAFPTWSTTPPLTRSHILLRAASLLRTHNNSLARTETLDTGKPFTETSTVDITTGADVLEYYAHLIASGGLSGSTTPLRPTTHFYTTKSPLGVCAAIGAWNYPLQIALWKAAPCLAAGNCLVYKPSEFTPTHALRLAEIFAEAGLPRGVFNVVQGAGDVGALLTSHADIAKVSFTGQVSTGSKVASAAAGGLKYVTMELGGKSPCIVLPDAEVENAVDGAMMANFFSSGQVCTNGTRVFVPRSMLEVFEKRLVEKMGEIRAGDVMDERVNFGPLVSRVHWEKVRGFIRHGIEKDGARLLYGGLGEVDFGGRGGSREGFWVRPTVFTGCTDEMRIVREEIFGPVMAILPYEDDGEGYVEALIARANDTRMGLAAGVFTRDVDLGHSVVARLEAGICWVNTWGESPAEMPVGGWKMSGLGVENGRRGLENWVQNKSTLVEMGGPMGTVFAKL